MAENSITIMAQNRQHKHVLLLKFYENKCIEPWSKSIVYDQENSRGLIRNQDNETCNRTASSVQILMPGSVIYAWVRVRVCVSQVNLKGSFLIDYLSLSLTLFLSLTLSQLKDFYSQLVVIRLIFDLRGVGGDPFLCSFLPLFNVPRFSSSFLFYHFILPFQRAKLNESRAQLWPDLPASSTNPPTFCDVYARTRGAIVQQRARVKYNI